MNTVFHPMNAQAASFPPPRVPVLPVIGAMPTLNAASASPPASVFDDGHNILVRSGRAAIALCLRLIGVRPGDEVLLPSYHCGSMVEPIIWAGATPVFFRVDRDLNANLDDIESALRRRPRAVLLTHFFGLSQPLQEVVRLCRRSGAVLIEDCAHAYFGMTDLDTPVGSVGDFAIASLPKFFPTAGGGLLRINAGDQRAHLKRRSGLRYELQACLEPHERAVRYGRGGPLSRGLATLAAWRKPMVQRLSAQREAPRERPAPAAGPGPAFRYLIPADIARPGALCTHRQWQRTDRESLVAARIRNWHALARGLGQLERAHLFTTSLPDGTVPYKLALIIENAEDFPALMRRGVPLWRWEDLAVSHCEVAADYRLRLLQVPCHQSLSDADVAWLIEQFQAVLGQRSVNEAVSSRAVRCAP